MAVCIASDLGKDMAGEPLLRGVSFKLERRERLTLSGRNGAGKTTLLRMLAGETSVDGGELVFAKGTRVALHDQRPPRDRDLTLRDYVLGGCGDLIALEEELARARGRRWPTATRRRHARRLLARPGAARARRRLQLARARDAASCAASASATTTSTARSRTFSGGELTRASLARALAGDPDLLLLDEPTNHLDIESLEWLEDAAASLDAAVVLVAHDRWFLEAVGTAVLELEGGPRALLQGPVARMAQGAGRARAGARPRDRAPAGRDRAARAVRRRASARARARGRRSRA